jgi:hypothetical protein
MFNKILEGEVVNPPLWLEWNGWRALTALDRAVDVRRNFEVDADLQPVNHAPGNVPDVKADYDSFAAVLEMTMMIGRTQYKHEGEPVTEHVARAVLEEVRSGSRRQVYGVFVAPRVHPGTAEFFRVYVALTPHPAAGANLQIVPLAVEQLQQLLRISRDVGVMEKEEVEELLGTLVEAGRSAKSAREWLDTIEATIRSWGDRLLERRRIELAAT